MIYESASEQETVALGKRLAGAFAAGDTVLIHGDLGAGKTTLIRGILQGLGHLGATRSPTFNLMNVFDLSIPVLHADLYRLTSASGLGLEDYLGRSLSLIEWPDRLGDLVDSERCWNLYLNGVGENRRIEVCEPTT